MLAKKSVLSLFKNHFNEGLGLVSLEQESLIMKELNKLDERSRDFIRMQISNLITGMIAIDGTMKKKLKQLQNKIDDCFSYLNLSVEYLCSKRLFPKQGLFCVYSPSEVYLIGLTLISNEQNKVKKLVDKYLPLKVDAIFLGKYWSDFIQVSKEGKISFTSFRGCETIALNSLKNYQDYAQSVKTFSEILPFAIGFLKTFKNLKQNLRDDFYRNYLVEEIDFEAIMLSSFINNVLRVYKNLMTKRWE